MGDPFQLAELARRQERKGILDVGRAAGVMAQLLPVVLAEPQALAGQPQVGIPAVTAVAPELVPGRRRRRMAEKLDLHLLELARAEGEVARSDLVAKALAHLGDAERHAYARAIEHVLEIDEDALRGFRTQEGRILFAPQRPDRRLEHQVELARLGERAQRLGVRTENAGEIAHRGERNQRPVPLQFLDVCLARRLKNFSALCSVSFSPSSPPLSVATKIRCPLASHPAALDLVVPVALLRLAAIHHVVVEQVVVARALPDLGVHDDRAVEAGHLVGRGGAGQGTPARCGPVTMSRHQASLTFRFSSTPSGP